MSETATPARRPRQGRSRRSTQLRITEIFHSLQGEARSVGRPTVFVRLTGCPLRCVYCDTAYAFHGGKLMALDEIIRRVGTRRTRLVTVTGGEPLAQPGCLELMRRLCDAGYAVSLETSGAMDISVVDRRVSRVVDIKTPGSGEVRRNLYANLGQLTPHDQVKFVLCDRRDYEWARDLVGRTGLADRCEVLFSPSHGVLDAAMLADWILGDALPVRFQIQLHKYLWGDVPGR
ncbi:MAG TPA: 7-carboxy-7-deazaguanine synthase QueE [Gammaproteobacteria bacterium]|nr:7-carboxy-7-deazaguanine synthase QueE [Gammaproteobacteria bacterium]